MGRSEHLKRAMMAPYGAPLRVAHRLVMQTQVGTVAAVDRLPVRRDPELDLWVAEQLTVTVKTFLRPATARRFVRSTRRAFSGHIVVADDSPEPVTVDDPGTTVLGLPFNSGVCLGRNAAIAAATTPFVMVVDDDVVMTAGTDLAGLVTYLEDHPEVDAVCASQIELPRWYALPLGDERALFPGHLPPLRAFGETVGGLPVVLKGPQVYVARTERLREVPYDERIRMVDHRDFFSSASGRLVFVSAPGVVVFHARTPFDTTYQSYRDDVGRDLAYLNRKWGAAATGATP